MCYSACSDQSGQSIPVSRGRSGDRSSQHRAAVLKSGYIYQLYTYLRSQERADDPLSLSASGVFLHPTVDGDLDETARIQGHEVRFVTVDLTLKALEIIQRLQKIIAPSQIQ